MLPTFSPSAKTPKAPPPHLPPPRASKGGGASAPCTIAQRVEGKLERLDIDVNPTSRAPNLRFPVPVFYEEDPKLCFFQLEQTFIVNKVTTQKDMYAVVISNLPYKVCRRLPRTISNEKQPYDVLKELVVNPPWTDKLFVSDFRNFFKCCSIRVPSYGSGRGSCFTWRWQIWQVFSSRLFTTFIPFFFL